MAETSEEIPTREQVLAGEPLHYDAEGSACALCMMCLQPIDLEFGDYAELSLTEKRGMERAGGRSKRLFPLRTAVRGRFGTLSYAVSATELRHFIRRLRSDRL